ncbi:MAG: methyltransferase domain-containing protein [Actinomycetales bacterium]|nr:methyltransferase domain-containing protein [Actinomycetales bacterium]
MRTVPVFDRVAGVFDEVLPFFATFAGQTVEALPLGDGVRLLDLGAGRGAVTGRALAAGCRVTAVDAAPAMVARLASDHPGAEVLLMDAHRLELPDAGQDVAVAAFVMHLLDDPVVAAREVRRVLVPGGQFALTVPDGVSGTGPGTVDPGPALIQEFSRYLPRDLRDQVPPDQGAVLAEAGFVDVERGHLEVCLPVPDAATYWRWMLSHGCAGYLDALPSRRQEELRLRIHEELAGLPEPVVHRGAALWTGRVPGRREA